MISTEHKNKTLQTLAKLIAQNTQEIISENAKDLAAYHGEDASMSDRLIINKEKVKGMISSIGQCIELEDPEGKTLYSFYPENGLKIENKTVPFGNILIIYESRPDVTIEASIAAFKAGNKILLKGGKEAINTNILLAKIWHKALSDNKLDKKYISYLNFNRTQTQALIKENTHQADLIIPRGGEGLINFVRQNTNIPIIISGRGNNFLFVSKDADFEIAINIVLNGKQRISVCNALDKVLFHKNIPNFSEKISKLITTLKENNIEIVADADLAQSYKNIKLNTSKNILDEEFLAPKIYLKIVENDQEAIQLINKHSGKHSACIVSSNQNTADLFLQEVDCAAVYHNASTRFTDGGQFGFGAEMAISTQKLHFRGPIGIHQLVTNKWIIKGNGQTR